MNEDFANLFQYEKRELIGSYIDMLISSKYYTIHKEYVKKFFDNSDQETLRLIQISKDKHDENIKFERSKQGEV